MRSLASTVALSILLTCQSQADARERFACNHGKRITIVTGKNIQSFQSTHFKEIEGTHIQLHVGGTVPSCVRITFAAQTGDLLLLVRATLDDQPSVNGDISFFPAHSLPAYTEFLSALSYDFFFPAVQPGVHHLALFSKTTSNGIIAVFRSYELTAEHD
jgi:hypothetical protein